MKKAKTFAQIIKGKPAEQPIQCSFEIKKLSNELKQVFGWANVAVRSSGEVIEDFQDDIIDIEDLERAAYDFVLKYRKSGEMHERSDVAVLIESIVLTKEKAIRMEIPDGVLPEAWWVGFQITDDEVWEKVKDGTYSMFSIEGSAIREEV